MPVRQVHLGGTLTASSKAATSGLAVVPASCVTTTTEPGASHGAELHRPGPRPGRRDRHPLASGQALLNPSAQLTEASDNTALVPSGWAWTGAGAGPAWSDAGDRRGDSAGSTGLGQTCGRGHTSVVVPA
jgi:hypothetical protein